MKLYNFFRNTIDSCFTRTKLPELHPCPGVATSTTITVRPVVHSLGPAWSERQSNARQHTMSSATIVTAPQAVRLTTVLLTYRKRITQTM